jgi:hypothetical protein
MALFVRRRWPTVAGAAVVVAALVVAAILLTRHDDARPGAAAFPTVTSEPPGPVDTPSPTPPMPLAAALAAPDPVLHTYAERDVTASGVPVLRRLGPTTAWVGGSAADRLLVVLVGVEHPFAFGTGARLSFDGAFRAADANTARGLELTGADAAELVRQGVYVEVTAYRTA